MRKGGARIGLFLGVLWTSSFQPTSAAEGWQDQSRLRRTSCTGTCVSSGAIKMAGYQATMGEVYGLTEAWVKEFFENPDAYIRQYFDIPSCGANPNCADIANGVLGQKKEEWAQSGDKGKILVLLAYMIG